MSRGSGTGQGRVSSLVRAIRTGGGGRRRPNASAGIGGEDIRPARFGWGLIASLTFITICGAMAIWARERPMVAVGRVMDTTRAVRVPLAAEDRAATEASREAARQRTPRVYVAEDAVLGEVATSLENLPRTLAGVDSISDVDVSIRDQFGLRDEHLAAVKSFVVDGVVAPEWTSGIARLLAEFRRRPIVDEQTWQRATQEGTHTQVRLVSSSGSISASRTTLMSLADVTLLREAMDIVVRDAGFQGPLRSLIATRLMMVGKPTYRFDAIETGKNQEAAAAAVKPEIKQTLPGQMIFRRGEVLTPAQAALYQAELREYRERAGLLKTTLRRISVVAAVGAVTAAISGYIALYCPRIRRNPGRMAGVAVLMSVALLIACVATAINPSLAALTTTAPTLFVTVILAIAYERRVALAFGVLHAVLVGIALDQGVGALAVTVTGLATAVWNLREVRGRNALVRMSVFTAGAMALGTAVVGMIDRPMEPAALPEAVLDAVLGAGAGLAVGAVVLFILPLLERAFDITTGMTLIELRDPSQPLLRELQARAPGTYIHSLNVAVIAEAAADAIGADGLLTYVGALYHDIGKMNKPEYFVENQQGGPNKHDRLSPAMSLLVIVGHVKDGMALADEFGLPRSIQQFIECHHGTTLVEYFFHRALCRAEASRPTDDSAGDDGDSMDIPDIDGPPPDEIEYRYPGPKPRTREAAIMMIADAVESATRSLTDPTSSRIESTVRKIANKRLMDGQFDDCGLTIRDLAQIVESISRTLAAVYHGRVQYPERSQPAEATGT